jgi:bacillithiol system protein YtxJ
VERSLRLEIMDWIKIDSEEKLAEAHEFSKNAPVLLFKHSTTCSISKTALSRLERNWKSAEVADTRAYYLDLLSFRSISNAIASHFEVEHQSPQVLIIKDGKSVYDRSHFDIEYEAIKREIEKLSN